MLIVSQDCDILIATQNCDRFYVDYVGLDNYSLKTVVEDGTADIELGFFASGVTASMALNALAEAMTGSDEIFYIPQDEEKEATDI